MAIRDYFDGRVISCPALIMHDPDDPFAPFAHAEYSARQIACGALYSLRAAGLFVWLGREALAMRRPAWRFCGVEGCNPSPSP